MSTPHRLRELRQAAGLTQVELAERAGMSQAALSQIENGKIALSLNGLRQLAAALDRPTADLLTAADNPDQLSLEERQFIIFLRCADEGERAMVARLVTPPDYPIDNPVKDGA